MKERMRLGAAIVMLALIGLVFGKIFFEAGATPAYGDHGSNAVEIAQQTAFGEVAVASITPMAAWAFQYGINSRYVTTSTVTGTVTVSNSRALLSTGAGANQSATMYTNRVVRYLPGSGGVARFTAVMTDCTAGSTQIIGLGDANNGFFFGCNGATFGILRRSNGTDTWTAQSAWTENLEPFIADIDITKGNVYQIQYQWLGYGEVDFYIEDRTTGLYELVHRLQYANANTDPSIFNPQLPLYASVANTTNDTDIQLFTPSAMGGTHGRIDDSPYPLSLAGAATVTQAVTTLQNVLTISNTSTFNGLTNAVQVRPLFVTVTGAGAQPVRIYIYRGATLGGSPSYTAYDAADSVVYYDEAGTTITGGELIFASTISASGSQIIDLTPLNVFLAPGETLTIAAQSIASNSVIATANWSELF